MFMLQHNSCRLRIHFNEIAQHTHLATVEHLSDSKAISHTEESLTKELQVQALDIIAAVYKTKLITLHVLVVILTNP